VLFEVVRWEKIVCPGCGPSCAGLTRASIFFAETFFEDRWIAGSSPAMTGWMACRNDRPLFSIDPNNDRHCFSLIRIMNFDDRHCFSLIGTMNFATPGGLPPVNPRTPLTPMWLRAPMRRAAPWARVDNDRRYCPRLR